MINAILFKTTQCSIVVQFYSIYCSPCKNSSPSIHGRDTSPCSIYLQHSDNSPSTVEIPRQQILLQHSQCCYWMLIGYWGRLMPRHYRNGWPQFCG